jgi:pimeloyl-ACP methyl ester carboxylesterase
VSESAAPASTSDALRMLRAALGYLATADPAAMAAEAQAECLQALERADAVSTVARAWILGAFTAGQGYAADADYSPRAWLIHRTRVTRGAAAAHTAWARRAAAHPQVAAELAEGQVLTESMARTICQWSDKLPRDCREAADAILVAAARAGADQQGLLELAAEIYARSLPENPDDDVPAFEDRSVRLETTFQGAGVITGDLTPECAAVVTAVLDALSAPAGAEDPRTREQRYHDALGEAMRRLVASGLLPQRSGQPVKAWVHVSLAELRAMDGDSVLEGQWITAVRARWAAHRAGASVAGGGGAAWLDGDAARAAACDASLTPIVTGEVDIGVLEDLVRLCVQLDRLGHDGDRDKTGSQQAPAVADAPAMPDAPAGPGSPAREALERAIIGKAADLLSGPGGLASFLRTRQLGARLAGPSLPLDIGYSENVPAGIRNAVIVRDRHCRWAGGCHQPAAACEVHHVRHQARGGKTSTKDCVLLCWFHHQVVIHRWGWTLVLNPDGTTTAWNPDRTKVLHSHGPPVLPVQGRITPRSPYGPLCDDISGARASELVADLPCSCPDTGRTTLSTHANPARSGAYAAVNGLHVYYETHGDGRPLVLLHGGVLTLDRTFGPLLPALAKNHQVIGIELQGHGHTADSERDMTLENLASDVEVLLGQLGIDRAAFLGFSLGGMVSLELAIRHPELAGRLVLASVPSRLDGYHPGTRPGAAEPDWGRLPTAADGQIMEDDYRRVAPDPGHFHQHLARTSGLVAAFRGWSADQLASLRAPTLLLIGDNDFVRIDHAAEMLGLIPGAQLAVLPGTRHMEVMQRADQVLALVMPFLDAPLPDRPT